MREQSKSFIDAFCCFRERLTLKPNPESLCVARLSGYDKPRFSIKMFEKRGSFKVYNLYTKDADHSAVTAW